MCVRMCDVCICVCMCCVCVVVVVLALKCNAQVLVCWGMWWCLRVGACGGACVLGHVVVLVCWSMWWWWRGALDLAYVALTCSWLTASLHAPGCMCQGACTGTHAACLCGAG